MTWRKSKITDYAWNFHLIKWQSIKLIDKLINLWVSVLVWSAHVFDVAHILHYSKVILSIEWLWAVQRRNDVFFLFAFHENCYYCDVVAHVFYNAPNIRMNLEKPLELSTRKYTEKWNKNENTINESLTNVLNINKDPKWKWQRICFSAFCSWFTAKPNEQFTSVVCCRFSKKFFSPLSSNVRLSLEKSKSRHFFFSLSFVSIIHIFVKGRWVVIISIRWKLCSTLSIGFYLSYKCRSDFYFTSI